MAGKRIIIIVIAVLLCSCVTVTAFADYVFEYSDTGGYDESGSFGVHGDIGIMLASLYRAPGIYPSKYFSHLICPHCGATGPDPEYIYKISKSVSGYDNSYGCRRCSCRWVAGVYGAFYNDRHFHVVDGELCAFDYVIDHGFYESGAHYFEFYCSKHKAHLHFFDDTLLFEVNTFWNVQIVGEDWEEPVSTPSLWETPFVPPYDSFATFEPVTVQNIGNKVNDMAAIVKVVYKGFPFFVTLLTIAIACSFLIVVVKG